MHVSDRGVQLLSKGEAKPRDTGEKAAGNLRMVRRFQSCRGIIVSLGARNRISGSEAEKRVTCAAAWVGMWRMHDDISSAVCTRCAWLKCIAFFVFALGLVAVC